MSEATTAFAATRFDGRRAVGETVVVRVEGNAIAVLSRRALERFALREVGVSEAFDHAPRMLALPGGATIEVPDPQRSFAAALAAAGVRESAVVRLQRAWPAVAAALLSIFGGVAWLYVQGVPLVASAVAPLIPPSVERRIGDQVLVAFDGGRFGPSWLADERQARLRARFLQAAAVSAPGVDVRLEFRAGPVNAFALPGGTIVLFDGLVHRARGDDEVLGVLGHELGHVVHRHSTRQLLQALGVGSLATFLWGDVSSIVANVPWLLGVMRYGRAFENEADEYAIAFLRANGIPVQPLLDFFVDQQERDAMRGRSESPEFLSTHPGTESRSERLRRAIEQDGNVAR